MFFNKSFHPGWVAQLLGVLFYTPKDCGFHIYIVGSVPSRGMYVSQLSDVSLFHSLSLPLSKHILW